jgi:hypothetical protein
MRDPNLAMDNGQPPRAGTARSLGRLSDNTRESIQQLNPAGYGTNTNGNHSETDHLAPAASATELRLYPRHSGFGDIRPRTSVTPRGTSLEQLYQTQLGTDNGIEDNPVAQALNLGRPPGPLLRAKSDFGHRGMGDGSDDEDWKMRHGWEDEFTSHEYLSLLNSVNVPVQRRHVSHLTLSDFRPSTCTSPTNATRLVASLETNPEPGQTKNGG